ncbi:hypothetical protein CYFUS_000706 [Cystobacter fuscus]|uniref:Uncharacterized protein n=1 Tax=Cystobacter fuscus TaxID=43 RepID=A0A250IU71_9BACT|nr:hypothetical protein [Cystobacter fuscus]ATB35294.1 hypothetical protein CYFUS_000706 [Cystobacter fuscus]
MSMKKLRTLALVAVAAPGIAAAQSFTDPTTYTIQPQKYPATTLAPGYIMNDNPAYPWESTVVGFDVNATYSPGQQNAIAVDERNRTGGTLSYDPSDYSYEVTVEQGLIPEANQHMVPGPLEFLPWTNPNQTFNKTYTRIERFGNSVFGAGYALNATVTADTATTNRDKKIDAVAEGKVFGTAFSYEKELVLGRANISGQQGGDNSGTAALYALGQQIWSTSLYATYSPTPINWSRTFFSATKRFMVGPVPISVKASLAGGVKLTVLGQIGPTVAKLSAIPGGWANVNASAAVDVVILAFGLEGALSLINASLPSSGEVFWPICTLDWKLKSNLELNTLSGTLKLFAKLKILFIKKTWWVTIASWSGITRNWSLLDLGGSQPLGICS